LGCLAALRADGIEHRALTAGTAAISLASAPTLGATGRFVLEALLCVELLFARRKREFSSAVTASQITVLKSHDSPQFFHVAETTKRRAA